MMRVRAICGGTVLVAWCYRRPTPLACRVRGRVAFGAPVRVVEVKDGPADGRWGLALLVTLLAGTPAAVAAARARRRTRARASDPPATTTSPSVREVSSE